MNEKTIRILLDETLTEIPYQKLAQVCNGLVILEPSQMMSKAIGAATDNLSNMLRLAKLALVSKSETPASDFFHETQAAATIPTTAEEVHEAIQSARAEAQFDVNETFQKILDIEFALLGDVQTVSKALLDLDGGELSDGRPCLTVGTRSALQAFVG
jgi:delta-aminolevulinic acid dehydratase/porphobilinogen synthase